MSIRKILISMFFIALTGILTGCISMVDTIREEAAQGNPWAQYTMGNFYFKGEGVEVEKDPAQAVAWYRKAAEQGVAAAQSNLGFCYQNGIGVEKDPAQAVAWWRKAAERGNDDAQLFLDVHDYRCWRRLSDRGDKRN